MDIKSYIESGILEQYVIGTLSSKDMAEVENNLTLYPELQKEVKAIELTLEAYAQHQGKAPSLTEDQLIENLHKSKEVASKSTPSSSNNLLSYLGWIVSASLIGILFYFNSDRNELNLEKNRTQSILDSLRINCAETEITNQLLQQRLDLLNNPASRFLLLAGTPLSPSSYASVIIDTTGNKLFFDFAGLPKPPVGKQYQLWVIKGGKPIDMGVINNADIAEIRNIEKAFISEAQAFALTLEDEGGKASPTLEQMYVVGSL